MFSAVPGPKKLTWPCILLLKWLIMGLIINTIYRSELKARLIAPTFQLPFKNVEEFAETQLTLGLPVGGALARAIQVSCRN